MFKVYLDASGTHGEGSRVVTVAGYLSTGDRWEDFKVAWKKVTGGVDFHMKDFVHARGAFLGWSENQKAALAADVAAVIRKHVIIGTACGLPTKVFSETARQTPGMALSSDGRQCASRVSTLHIRHCQSTSAPPQNER